VVRQVLTIRNVFKLYLWFRSLKVVQQRIGLKVPPNPNKIIIVNKDHVTLVCVLCDPYKYDKIIP